MNFHPNSAKARGFQSAGEPLLACARSSRVLTNANDMNRRDNRQRGTAAIGVDCNQVLSVS